MVGGEIEAECQHVVEVNVYTNYRSGHDINVCSKCGKWYLEERSNRVAEMQKVIELYGELSGE